MISSFRPRVELPRLDQTLLLFSVSVPEEVQLAGRHGSRIESMLCQDIMDTMSRREGRGDGSAWVWRSYMGRVMIVLGDTERDRVFRGRGQLSHCHLSVKQRSQLVLQFAIAFRH